MANLNPSLDGQRPAAIGRRVTFHHVADVGHEVGLGQIAHRLIEQPASPARAGAGPNATTTPSPTASARASGSASAVDNPQPFGAEFPNLESLTTGEWWTKGVQAAAQNETKKAKGKGKGGGATPPPSMDVPRDEVVCFAYYTHQNGVLKMSAQLFPLKPGEVGGEIVGRHADEGVALRVGVLVEARVPVQVIVGDVEQRVRARDR